MTLIFACIFAVMYIIQIWVKGTFIGIIHYCLRNYVNVNGKNEKHFDMKLQAIVKKIFNYFKYNFHIQIFFKCQ